MVRGDMEGGGEEGGEGELKCVAQLLMYMMQCMT